MPPIIATLIFIVGIIGLFWLDRERTSRTSPALWITFAWFFFACSRSFGRWLNLKPTDLESITEALSEGSPLDRVVFAGLLLLGLMVLAQRSERVGRILRQSVPILLFFGFCLVSLVWSDYPSVGFKRWIKTLGDWTMILIIWTDRYPTAAFKKVLARLTYTLIPLSILFIKYYPAIGRNYGRWLGEVHYLGVTTDKNTLGEICLLFGLWSVWQVLNLLPERKTPERRRHLLVQFVMLAMIGWLFSIMNAMTSLACFMLGTCGLFAMRLRLFARNRVMVHLMSMVMVFVPVSVALLGVSPSALHAMGRNSTLTERTDIWAMVIQLTPNRWIGAGYESFWLGPRLQAMVENVTRWWVPNQSHNGYLEIYANLGWLGIMCLSVVIIWGYGRVIRGWRGHVPASDLMLVYFLSAIVFNLTEAAFFRMMIPVWLFLLLAMTAPHYMPGNTHIASDPVSLDSQNDAEGVAELVEYQEYGADRI